MAFGFAGDDVYKVKGTDTWCGNGGVVELRSLRLVSMAKPLTSGEFKYRGFAYYV